MTDSDQTKTFFSDSIEQNTASLYRLAYRLTGNRADAEDLVSETVIRAWSAITSLNDRDRFRPWIFRILHNIFITDYRKKSIRPVESAFDECNVIGDEDEISALMIQQPDDFMFWWANPEIQFVNNLLGESIMAAINALPDAFRVTVLLVNVEGLSYDDAAAVLDVPPGTVRSRMKRGRTLLQKALWQQAKDEGFSQMNQRGK